MDYGPGTERQLKALQLERLRWSVGHAYANVPAFRAKCERLGVAPDDVRSLGDIARFPFTTKAELRDNYPDGLFAVPQEKLARIHASSGTTGRPTIVGYTAEDIQNWAGLVARSIHAAGGRAGMKVHVAYGYGLFTGGLGAHYGAEALGCTVIPVSGGQTERQVMLIGDLKPDIIMVTPSYMLAILDEYRRQGRDPAGSSLRFGIFGAEPWSDGMRREIESGFGLEAADIYGLSEILGPGVAQEVRGTRGPTIWEDHFLAEIVDPQSGEPLRDGEEGELVFTTLTKQALPMIRYRTRDLTRLLPGKGLPYRRMENIGGRSDDMLIVRGVNVFPTQIEELVLNCRGLGPHFNIEVRRPQRMDEVKILVERRPEVADSEDQAMSRELATLIKRIVGVTAEVQVLPYGKIDRSTGKANRVRDLRSAGPLLS